MSGPGRPPPGDPFARRVAIAAGIAAIAALLVALLWFAVDVFLLVFGGVLVGVFLRALSDPLAHHTRLRPGWALTLVVALLLALTGLAAWLLTPAFAAQLGELRDTLPGSIARLRELLASNPLGRLVLRMVGQTVAGPPGLDGIQDLVTGSAGVAVRFAVYSLTVGFIGLFVAYEPALYVEGALRLVPRARRARGREVLDAMGHALRWFLIGRVLAMALVGVLTAVELWLLGVPLAILLGTIAAVLTFVPYVGPILGGVPIALVTLVQSPGKLLLVLGLYTVIQNLEGYLITPLIQQRTVSLAPALTLVAQVLLGLLLGGLGVAIATPLAAAALVFVRMVYVEDVLGDREAAPRHPP